MATELPYLASYKNVGELFARIETAKQPDNFTQKFLAESLGLSASTDRPLIALLKTLGFLDSAGKPTAAYGHLKNKARAPLAIAEGVRKAYSPLFDANEKANSLQAAELRGLVSQVAGSDSGMTGKIAGTFSALTKLGDFASVTSTADETDSDDESEADTSAVNQLKPSTTRKASALRPEFHYNIQVHLPANASEENYLTIFNALRKSFSA